MRGFLLKHRKWLLTLWTVYAVARNKNSTNWNKNPKPLFPLWKKKGKDLIAPATF